MTRDMTVRDDARHDRTYTGPHCTRLLAGRLEQLERQEKNQRRDEVEPGVGEYRRPKPPGAER